MYTKQEFDGFAKRLLNNMENDRRELYDTTYEMPVSYFLSEERWKREVDVVLKRQPVFLAFSCELSEPNSYVARNPIGVPVLLTRGDDGHVRGFINKCRHRGACITGKAEKRGTSKRFVCPYHAWTYDNKGGLVRVPSKEQFGDVPDDHQRLIPLTVEEAAGIIWGVLTPGVGMNLEEFLGDMLSMLERLGLESFHLFGTSSLRGPNWKIAMDGYIENYHFNVLHKNSFGLSYLHDYGVYDDVGPHTRHFYAHPDIRRLRDTPEAEWEASKYCQVGHYIFPNSACGFTQEEDPYDQIFNFNQIWPGDSPGTSITHFYTLTPKPITTEEGRSKVEQFMDLTIDLIDREDYWVGRTIQNGLSEIQDKNFMYGRMERMCQNFERTVNALVDDSYRSGEIAAE